MRTWDPQSRGGTLLLDDGRQLEFPGAAVQVRGLRLGQRVQLRLEGDQVVALTIATLPFT
ncbi:MAG: Cold shock CspA family protein [Frankiales bacterium]|nr:Cold shock CspA family protein [Frankiales bacterium]